MSACPECKEAMTAFAELRSHIATSTEATWNTAAELSDMSMRAHWANTFGGATS